MANRLKGSSVYLCGPIDGAKDHGKGWRNSITPILEDMGLIVINTFKENGDWSSTVVECRRNNDVEGLAALSHIRDKDLKLVDDADFLVCRIDMNEHPVGSWEEIFLSLGDVKPVLIHVVGPPMNISPWLYWSVPLEHIFSTQEEMIAYLHGINEGSIEDEYFMC